MFQLLIASARRSIRISATYHLPDRSTRAKFRKTVRRGVRVQVVVPSVFNNYPIDRQANRRRYGGLLRASVEMLENEPDMNRCMVPDLDEVWVVVERQQQGGHGDSSVLDVVVLEGSRAACSVARNRPGPESVVDYRGVVDADQTAIASPMLF